MKTKTRKETERNKEIIKTGVRERRKTDPGITEGRMCARRRTR